MAGDTRRRLEDLPRSRLLISAVGARSSRGPPGDLQFSVSAALRRNGSSAVGFVSDQVVETRRLELLTLSLQRRCSAN